MKKRLMAVLLCVCMAAVLLTPYASVLTADGALRLGIAGAENGQDLTGESSSTPTEGGEEAESAETLKEEAPEATATAEPEATATTAPEATAPEATATTAPEATKAPAPKYTLDSNRAVYKDGATLRGEPKDCVVKASYSVAQAYKGPTDRSEAKTYKAGDRVRVYDEIQYEDCDGAEQKWSVVLDGSDFYFVLSEALESAPELPAQAPAQTDMKSLFGIGDNVDPASINPGDTAVRTYIFKYNDKEITRQSVKDGDTLEPVTAPVGPNERFVKWVIKDTETEVKFDKVSGVDKTEEVIVTAVVEKVYTVYFKTADGLVLDTKQGTKDETISNFETVDLKKYQLAANQSVIGWQDESGKRVTSVRIENKDITLTAVIGEGYWITFDSNGGSYVAPAFYLSDTEATAPTNPTKPGYTFENWYTDEELTQKANFGTINTNKTVYAKWTEQTNVKYTVIHWWENADDDEYSFKENETKLGATGALTDAKAKSYQGFTVNTTDKPLTQQTIKGDGSTIVNVYYKRNVYEVKFCEWKGGLFSGDWKEISNLTITAKYGANIKESWPGGIWYVGKSSNSAAQAGLEIMPLEGKSFYGKVENAKNPAYYYVEVLPGESGTVNYGGKTFKLDHTDYWPSDWSVSEEDRYEIKGFTFLGGTNVGSSLNNAKFYYTRNTYKVVYINTGSEGNKEQPYKYQQDISDAKDLYKPTQPPVGKEGYEFAGWYEDPAGQTEYNFTGKTMPANNITVYAKWVPETHTVTVYDANKTTELKKIENIPLGNKISEEEMPKVKAPDGSAFLGWVMADGNPFNFDTEIRKDYNLYALVGSKDGYTVTYDKNGGEGTVPVDPNKKYAAGTKATVLDKGGLTPPADKEFFLGWATTADATTAEYQPGGTMTIVAEMANKDREITLYAVWGDKPATTTLTYNANYPGADPATVLHKENNSEHLPNNTKVKLYGADKTFTREGFELTGWAKTANATEAEYKPGDEVIVDTIGGAAANTLYAVWKQSTTTVTVTKVVTGNFADKTKTFAFQYKKDGDPEWTNVNPLSDGGSFTIDNVTPGSRLFIREMPEGYTASVGSTETSDGHLTGNPTDDGYYTATITGVVANETITFTNHKEQTPDTGVILDSLPYVLILAVVALGAAGVVIRRRRHREDD